MQWQLRARRAPAQSIAFAPTNLAIGDDRAPATSGRHKVISQLPLQLDLEQNHGQNQDDSEPCFRYVEEHEQKEDGSKNAQDLQAHSPCRRRAGTRAS
jgi:hypothetical protein